MKNYLKILLFIITIIITPAFGMLTIQAEEFHNHEAHEHGVARINVALEGNDLYIELTTPAANIVGFEHHPRTQEQKATVKEAITTLKAGEKLFALSPGAGGKLIESDIHTDIDREAGHESEDDHSDEHEATSRKNEHEDDKVHRENHDSDGHDRHSEFTAEYHFVCATPGKLKQIDVLLFRDFPGIEHIEVQLLTATRQTAIRLTAKKNFINF